jgi:hypothetical protein
MAKHESTLDLKFNGVAGRPALTTARAFIRKRGRHGIYQSHVCLCGKKETITASTIDRATARTFNLLHLSDAIRRLNIGNFPKS